MDRYCLRFSEGSNGDLRVPGTYLRTGPRLQCCPLPPVKWDPMLWPEQHRWMVAPPPLTCLPFRRQRPGCRHVLAVYGARVRRRGPAEADGWGGLECQQEAGGSMAGGYAQGTVSRRGPWPGGTHTRQAPRLSAKGVLCAAYFSSPAGHQAPLRVAGPVMHVRASCRGHRSCDHDPAARFAQHRRATQPGLEMQLEHLRSCSAIHTVC